MVVPVSAGLSAVRGKVFLLFLMFGLPAPPGSFMMLTLLVHAGRARLGKAFLFLMLGMLTPRGRLALLRPPMPAMQRPIFMSPAHAAAFLARLRTLVLVVPHATPQQSRRP
jgi:hypothetical protein